METLRSLARFIVKLANTMEKSMFAWLKRLFERPKCVTHDCYLVGEGFEVHCPICMREIEEKIRYVDKEKELREYHVRLIADGVVVASRELFSSGAVFASDFSRLLSWVLEDFAKSKTLIAQLDLTEEERKYIFGPNTATGESSEAIVQPPKPNKSKSNASKKTSKRSPKKA